MAFAAAGVLYLTFIAGHPPWIALMVGSSFAFYGLIRKTVNIDALPGLAVETILLAQLKKKKPQRSDRVQYWTEGMFDKLKGAPPGKLYSKGPLPWRLLAYLLKISPEVARIRAVIRKRLMDENRIQAQDAALDRMLITLFHAGYVTLLPELPPSLGTPGEGPGVRGLRNRL